MIPDRYIVCELDSGPYRVTDFDNLRDAVDEYSEAKKFGAQVILAQVISKSSDPT